MSRSTKAAHRRALLRWDRYAAHCEKHGGVQARKALGTRLNISDDYWYRPKWRGIHDGHVQIRAHARVWQRVWLDGIDNRMVLDRPIWRIPRPRRPRRPRQMIVLDEDCGTRTIRTYDQ